MEGHEPSVPLNSRNFSHFQLFLFSIIIIIIMSALTAVWVLGHPPIVFLNKKFMLAAASLLSSRQLRSSFMRPSPP
jgi:hypothetical protein